MHDTIVCPVLTNKTLFVHVLTFRVSRSSFCSSMPAMPTYSLSNNIGPNPACLQSSASSYSCMLPGMYTLANAGVAHHLQGVRTLCVRASVCVCVCVCVCVSGGGGGGKQGSLIFFLLSILFFFSSFSSSFLCVCVWRVRGSLIFSDLFLFFSCSFFLSFFFSFSSLFFFSFLSFFLSLHVVPVWFPSPQAGCETMWFGKQSCKELGAYRTRSDLRP